MVGLSRARFHNVPAAIVAASDAAPACSNATSGGMAPASRMASRAVSLERESASRIDAATEGAAANGKLGGVASAVAGLTAAKAAEYKAAVASKNETEIARLLGEGAAANGKLASVASAVASLTAAKAAEYKAAVASKNEPEIARLLREGAAARGNSGGTTTRSTLKVPGCLLTVTEITPTGGREGECILKASRDEKNERFRISCTANGGVFGCQRFDLNVPDTKSGAKADNLGNIINLPPFEIVTRDGRRFEIKFKEIIPMKNVAASSAGVDEAEAVLP